MNYTADIEEELLGVCLTTPGAIREVAGMIQSPKTFASATFQKIYEAMLALHNQSYPTDIIAVTNELTRRHGDTGELNWIQQLTSLLPASSRSTGGLTYKCQIVIEQSLRRALLTEGQRLIEEASSPMADPFRLMDTVTGRIDKLRNRLHELSEKPFSDSLMKAVQIAEEAQKSGNPITGTASMLHGLDAYTKGFQPATSTIMAARPAMGKTAQLCQMAYNMAIVQEIPVVIFQLEMNNLQMARRLLAIDADMKHPEVSSGMDKSGKPVDIAKLFNSAGRMSGSPMFSYDKIRTIPQIKSKVSQLVSRNKIQVVFLDYLQLALTGTRMDSDIRVRVSEVSREIKEIANNYEIAVIALAQLSREVDKRTNKRPVLADLKESGSIEQDADNVIFLYRPGYYATKDENGLPIDESLLYNIMAKNRSGSTHSEEGGIMLHYDRATNRIRDYDTGMMVSVSDNHATDWNPHRFPPDAAVGF